MFAAIGQTTAALDAFAELRDTLATYGPAASGKVKNLGKIIDRLRETTR